MKFCIFLTFAFSIITTLIFAQNNLTGIVLDYDTKVPVSCATVYLSGWDTDLEVRTGEDGRFTFTELSETEYYIEVSRDYYRIYINESYDITTQGSEIEILLYSYESESYRITDVADQDIFDMGLAANFYCPTLLSSDEAFKRNSSFEFYNMNVRFKLANNLQMGFIYIPIKLSWNLFTTPAAGYSKERYFGAYTTLSVHFRLIATTIKANGSRGLFIDLGTAYNLPYYFAHSAFTNDYTKLTTRNIHRFNEFEAFARIGFNRLAVKINYRFTDILNPTYIQPPKLSLGLEMLIPLSE